MGRSADEGVDRLRPGWSASRGTSTNSLQLPLSPGPMPSFECSFDTSRLDVDAIHAFLAGTYWSPGIPRDTVQRAIDHSRCIGG